MIGVCTSMYVVDTAVQPSGIGGAGFGWRWWNWCSWPLGYAIRGWSSGTPARCIVCATSARSTSSTAMSLSKSQTSRSRRRRPARSRGARRALHPLHRREEVGHRARRRGDAGAALLREHRSSTVPFACVRTTEPSSVASKRLMLTRKLGFFAHARSIRANVSCSVAGCSQLSSVTPSTRC